MKVNGKEVTKEWHKNTTFERVLSEIKANAKNDSDLEFSREYLMRRINSDEFGGDLIATNSPAEGSVSEIYEDYKNKGKEWLDIQNLTYHYSHQNPNGNYHSHKKHLEHLRGKGDNSRYRIIKRARKIKDDKDTTYDGGTESNLRIVGGFILTLGIISLIACIIISGIVTQESSYDDWGENGVSFLWIAIGIGSLFGTIVLFVVFYAGSDIIKLLKKLNGLKYAGKISEATAFGYLSCSECGTIVTRRDVKCHLCETTFEEENIS